MSTEQPRLRDRIVSRMHFVALAAVINFAMTGICGTLLLAGILRWHAALGPMIMGTVFGAWRLYQLRGGYIALKILDAYPGLEYLMAIREAFGGIGT